MFAIMNGFFAQADFYKPDSSEHVVATLEVANQVKRIAGQDQSD
jgi:hypothetical protein